MTEGPAGTYRVAGESSAARIAVVAGWLAEGDLPLGDLRAGRRSLEEVYLEVTSKVDGGVDAPHLGDDAPAGGLPTRRDRP